MDRRIIRKTHFNFCMSWLPSIEGGNKGILEEGSVIYNGDTAVVTKSVNYRLNLDVVCMAAYTQNEPIYCPLLLDARPSRKYGIALTAQQSDPTPMMVEYAQRVDWRALMVSPWYYLQRPYRIVRSYEKADFRPDLIAGLTVSVIMLPQAMAFALVAELPPYMGLYAAVIGGFFGAMWGSSNQLRSGPANAISLLVFSSLSTVVATGSPEYILAAGLLAVMVGVFQFLMGVLHLGMLVNFVSHSVIVGFTAGAGILIVIKQIGPLLGLEVSGKNLPETLFNVVQQSSDISWLTLGLGLITIVIIVFLRRISRQIPAALVGMIVATLLVYYFGMTSKGVATIGVLPSGFPPIAPLPIFDLSLIADLSTAALAVGAIGLVESSAISRSLAAQTGQRLDNNQEFVGQGISNVMMGIFSGFPGAGSFSRSAVNFNAGARTPIAAVISSILVLLAMFTLAPVGAYIPRAALSGVLMVTAYGLIDRDEIRRIWHSHPGDAIIMIVTFLGTLFLTIEFAVLAGIILSLVVYLLRTSMPRVRAVVPDDSYHHFAYQPDKEECPQLGVIEILGDLYFGAVNNVEEFILRHADEHPEQRFLMLRMRSVNSIDFSGIHMLETVVNHFRERGGDVYIVRANYKIMMMAARTHFDEFLGMDHFLNEDEAVSFMFYHVLDPAICIYECPVRVFKECVNLPKRMDLVLALDGEAELAEDIPAIQPRDLWRRLHPAKGNGKNGRTPPPLIIDVREPREYRQHHIPEAELHPLAEILAGEADLPKDREIVIVCRSSRRSRRAAAALRKQGYTKLAYLEGGIQGWESANLLEAIE